MYCFDVINMDSDLILFANKLDDIKKRYKDIKNNYINECIKKGKEVVTCHLTKHPFSNDNYCVRKIVYLNTNKEKKAINTIEKNKTYADALLFRITVIKALKKDNCVEVLSDKQVDDEFIYLSKYR